MRDPAPRHIRQISEGGPSSGRIEALRLCMALALFAVAGLGAAIAAMPQKHTDVAAALFPPWWTESRIFSAVAAIGDVAGEGAVRSIVIVRSDRPDLATHLREAGALLVLAADGPFGCRSPSTQDRRS